ncbi:MAG: response regulator [Synergistaceae bacterium]|nr:response regulator [Synergistaceae bacterium]
MQYLTDDTFIEFSVLPFLIVMAAFLAGRMSTKNEINRRFLLLVFSTLISALMEGISRIFPALSHEILFTKIFYALVNINAYCLMCYVASYTGRLTQTFKDVNFALMFISLACIFIFNPIDSMYMIFCPGFAVFFALEGFVLQLIFQKYYGNGQFLVMNLLFLLLIDAFVIQYIFEQTIPLVYTVSTIMLLFTFFYMEAPTYKLLIAAHKETEQARVRTEASIVQANIANKAKSNFLASTSHEIRTPMNAILGINEMILNENPDKETLNAAQAMKIAGEYLLNLVNNILDISKIEAGKMDLFEANYHLWELLKDCESFVADRLKNKTRFVLNADKNLSEHLFGDSLRLKQVLTNLLDNAAKYTQTGSITLSVTGERHDSNIKLVFTVKDTGIGMKPEELGKIFEPFERANVLETRHIMGAGLGLNLVRNIVNIMNGIIEVKSTYGEGTEFTVTIPQKIAQGEHYTIQEYDYFMNMNEKAKAIESEKESEPEIWPDAKILIVDDTPVNLVVAKGMLKNTEAKIDTSESGEDALDKIKAGHYDVVFLDHKMPGMDGIETLNHAKKHAENTKFIALTANAGANARAEYISYGFDDYLPKPFKSQEMMRILKSCLNNKKRE